jgi:signal transduction histidine kinase
LAVIVYALSKRAARTAKQSGLSTKVTISITIACVAMVTAGLTWVATAGAGHLPTLYSNELQQAPFTNYVNVFLSLLSTAAIALLFMRRWTVLDQWLMVTLLAWLPNFFVSILFTVVRFTAGWYVARIYALIAGSSLLFVLLFETVVHYGHLASAIVRLRREQETKITSAQAIVAAIAHEIRQPLTRITAGGGAAQRFLEMVPPQHDKAKAALAGVVNAGHTTSGVIDGFRSVFGKADEEQQLVDMNELIPEVLETLHSEAPRHPMPHTGHFQVQRVFLRRGCRVS